MSMNHQFERITQQIIQAIKEGADQYKMPWHALGDYSAAPCNAVTGKPYRGLNILALSMAALSHGYPSGRWASCRQWSSHEAYVRKGEKGTPIFFWQAQPAISATDGSGDEKANRRFVARCYHVFNEAQLEKPPRAKEPSASVSPTETDALALFKRLDAKVLHGGDRAYFDPASDLIRLPEPSQFANAESYFAVRAHETVHWTGAKSRLDRNLSGRFGGEAYAMEELIAELGAAFLCARLRVSQQPRRDHAAYIASWLSVLRSDTRAILTAASKAQQAVDFVLGEVAPCEDDPLVSKLNGAGEDQPPKISPSFSTPMNEHPARLDIPALIPMELSNEP